MRAHLVCVCTCVCECEFACLFSLHKSILHIGSLLKYLNILVDSCYFVFSTIPSPFTSKFFFSSVLANVRPLHLHVNLDRFCQFPQRSFVDIFIVITLNLLNQLGKNCHYNIVNLQIILNAWHIPQLFRLFLKIFLNIL